MLNKYIYELGVSKKWNVVDVYGTEPEMLDFVPKPVHAVILLAPCSEAVISMLPTKISNFLTIN